MANEEHYRLFTEAVNQEQKQQGAGRKFWNNWRIANPEVTPDLSKVSFPSGSQSNVLSPAGSGIKLLGFDFSRANLSGSYFSMPNLKGANLSGADLANAILCWGNLSRANLQGANLKKVNLNEADLASADFSNADLKEAQLGRANFRGAILRGADLREAILHHADFSRPINAKIFDTKLIEAYNGASLRGANLNGAKLEGANLSGADLVEADFSEARLSKADLTYANLREAKFIKTNLWRADLTRTILESTNLSGSNLSEAKLRGAYFIGANLVEANLTMADAVATDFRQAILTGACLEDWNISSHTKLDNVICDYIYFKGCQKERRPHNGNFAPGNFAKLFQDLLDTVDLIFNEGVNWKAFAYSFHNTQVVNDSTPLTIRSIENKGDGFVLIRVSVPPDADKCKIHAGLTQDYELAQKALESQYQARLEDKDKHINQLFYLLNQAQEKSGEIQKLMAEKSRIQQNFHGNIGSVAGNVEGDQKSIQHNYASEKKQTLAEAAAEIQQLLKQLEQTNPTATEAEKKAYVTASIPPTLRARTVSALKAGGKEALKEVLDNPYVNIGVAIVEGWQSPE